MIVHGIKILPEEETKLGASPEPQSPNAPNYQNISSYAGTKKVGISLRERPRPGFLTTPRLRRNLVRNPG